jgi:hypothetical protein
MELSLLQRRKAASQGSISAHNSVPSNSVPGNHSTVVPDTNTSTVPSNLATAGSVTSPEGKTDPLGITGFCGAQGNGNGAGEEFHVGSVEQGTSAEGQSSSLEVQMGSLEGGQTTTSGHATTESLDPDSLARN